jgi:radical SAM enzyme (TIGR01210 family)
MPQPPPPGEEGEKTPVPGRFWGSKRESSLNKSLPAERDLTGWISAQRPSRSTSDPSKPNGFFLEQEPAESGQIRSSAVILLTNKECPWRCLMCDLWKHTLTQTVPPGAIPQQIDYALSRLPPQPEQIKLYNSGSFFDPAAIPSSEYPAIAGRIRFAQNLVVESHPRLVGERALRLRDLLEHSLEVAIGLETIHPEILPRLNKRFTLAQFERSVQFLTKEDIAVRAFVLVKLPFMNEEEGIEWAVRSAKFAFACGAGVVSFIPTRPGNGALDRLVEAGLFTPPRLDSLERALEGGLNLHRGRSFADTWNLEQFSQCTACLQNRRQRLLKMNLEQAILPRIACPSCRKAG